MKRNICKTAQSLECLRNLAQAGLRGGWEVTDTNHWKLNTTSGGRGGASKEEGPRRQMDR